MTKIVGMLVFCRNASGAPEIYQTNVHCTQARFDEGGHYDLAMSEAALRGYEPVLAADEHDPAYMQFLAPKAAPQTLGESAPGGKAHTRYVCEVKVEDPESGIVDTLEVHVDEASGAMFAVDAIYLDQVSERGVSPYTGQDILFAEPAPRAEDAASALQVAIAEQDVRAMVGELHAARLELVECYRWASTQKVPVRQSQMDSLKARADSIDHLLKHLNRRLPSRDADGYGRQIDGQIVSVSGDQDDPDQEVLVEVYAFVQGGVVQGVTASAPVKVTVVDYDVDRGDGERLVAISDQHGGSDRAEVGEMRVNVDPSACAALAEAIGQADTRVESRPERGG